MSSPITQIQRFVIEKPPLREQAAEPRAAGAERPARPPRPHVRAVTPVTPMSNPRPAHLASQGRRALPPALRTRSESSGDGPLVAAGLLLGVGLAGVFRGLVVHPLLRGGGAWPGPGEVDAGLGRTVALWDGAIHAVACAALIAGLALLWRAARRDDAARRTATLVGSILLGCGFLGGVEGVADLQIFALRHVHPGHLQALWDGGLIASGLILMLVGGLCVHLGRR